MPRLQVGLVAEVLQLLQGLREKQVRVCLCVFPVDGLCVAVWHCEPTALHPWAREPSDPSDPSDPSEPSEPVVPGSRAAGLEGAATWTLTCLPACPAPCAGGAQQPQHAAAAPAAQARLAAGRLRRQLAGQRWRNGCGRRRFWGTRLMCSHVAWRGCPWSALLSLAWVQLMGWGAMMRWRLRHAALGWD